MRAEFAAPVALAVALALGLWAWRASVSRTPEAPGIPGYDLAHPTASFDLPVELDEISALADVDDRTVAAVQDELGIVYFLDARSGAITRRIPFGPAGDYEGLARVDDVLWVLRSDGLLIELVMRDDALAPRRDVMLGLDHREFEGLGHDPVDGALLVAPKSPAKGKTRKARREVYRFDPVAATRLDDAALETTTQRIAVDAARRGIRLPTKSTKRGRERTDLDVHFSAIAVHPVTHQLFALSAADLAVLVFDRTNALVAMHRFDERDLPQPEGLAFLPNGDLVVASEGKGRAGRLRVYSYAP